MRDFLKKFNMRKINKITNIALIFTLIIMMTCQNLVYSSDITCLRVPIALPKTYERMEDEMNQGKADGNKASGSESEDLQLVDMPKEVISIVHQFASFNEFEKWLEDVFSDINIGGQLSKEALSFLETITLLFGFESKPDKSLLDSKGSILKNKQIDKEDKERIYEVFYDSERYPPR